MPKLKNCPKKIKIAGYEYEIKCLKTSAEVEQVSGMHGCIGAINTLNNVIVYPEDVNEQQNVNTLLHEVVHGVIHHYTVPISTEDNEAVTLALANGLFQVFIDNPKFLKIFEKGGDTDGEKGKQRRQRL